MVNVLLVHGRSRPLFGAKKMREQWLVALHSGFDAAGVAVPFGDDDVRLPWYGDTLTQLVGGAARADAERVSLRGDLPGDERAFVLDVVTQVAAEYAFTPAQLREGAATQDRTAVTPTDGWGYVRNVLAAVDRLVPGVNGSTVAFVARECFGYVTDARLRQTIDDGVARVGRPDDPTIVIGHSLGAVIAYHVLRTSADAQGWKVPLFLTLGAPLAWRAVSTALGRLETRRMPASVVNWVNARDPQDAVAIGGDLVGAFLPVGAGLPDVIEDHSIENPDDGRHAIEYYLADPAVAEHITAALA